MTNNKQQTTVEWLIEQLSTQFTYGQKIQFERLFEMAKERDKEQAIKLHYEYELYVMMNESDEMITESNVMTFGQFYKQTYGGNK
jgi:hypothetical protein